MEMKEDGMAGAEVGLVGLNVGCLGRPRGVVALTWIDKSGANKGGGAGGIIWGSLAFNCYLTLRG